MHPVQFLRPERPCLARVRPLTPSLIWNHFMLEITRLGHAYAGQTVLSIDSFSLAQGAHALLLGPSGSGKSTLLNLVGGILTLQSGKIALDGDNIGGMAPRAADAWRARHIGLLPQQLALVPSLSVFANIILPSYAAGTPPDLPHVRALLDALSLSAYGSAKPKQLSQGQRQRVALARALYSRPRLLLADEPTANLDDDHCAQVIALLLAQAQAACVSLLIASHDARLVQAFANAQVLRLPAAGSHA
jgi:putative ABC transport system ATP-binding protein